LPLGAPGIPGRGGEQENISAQQILWLRFLGHRFIDPPAWDSALQRIDQRLHHVLRVTASRGKDDMEGPTLNEVRDSLGGIGDVARRALKRSTHVLEQKGIAKSRTGRDQAYHHKPCLGQFCQIYYFRSGWALQSPLGIIVAVHRSFFQLRTSSAPRPCRRMQREYLAGDLAEAAHLPPLQLST
jgi:hypothetical protein